MNPNDDRTRALELKVEVLRHLRTLVHESAITQQPRPLDLVWVAFYLHESIEAVQGAINELLILDFVEPAAEESLAITNGDCRITKAGMLFLNQVEIAEATRSGPGKGWFGLDG